MRNWLRKWLGIDAVQWSPRCGRTGEASGKACRWDIAESGEIRKPEDPNIDGHYYELRCRVCGWMVVRDLENERL